MAGDPELKLLVGYKKLFMSTVDFCLKPITAFRWGLLDLSGALLLSCGLLALPGCVRHHTVFNSSQYTLHAETELPVLTPPSETHDVGGIQAAMVRLSGHGPNRNADPVSCSISGDVFSLLPSSTADTWEVLSPSLQGWQVRFSQLDVTEEWGTFVGKLALLQESHCFAEGLDVYAIQRAIVRVIPFPADQALLFAYSFGNTGYVDLKPGLQVRLESSSEDGHRTESIQFDVVASDGEGVKLKAAHRGLIKASELRADLAEVSQLSQEKPFLRLFLQQATTGTEQARDSMLLGTSDVQSLVEASRRIAQEGISACAKPPTGTRCVVFAEGGMSLLAAITVNHRTRFYAPGTTLGQILDALPEREQQKAISTVAVERPSDAGLYARIAFRHSAESTGLLILLSGDRVSWAR
jgi:hypothetical protein